MSDYLTVPLDPSHVKDQFDCGKDLLSRYLRQQAKQDVKRHLAACFVLTNPDRFVMGYYTLSSASIPRDVLPEEIIRKLPGPYHHLPVTLLGRLAIDKSVFGQGYGALLLIDALKRAYKTSLESIASMAVVVDPIDEEAIGFYRKYGFVLLPDSGKMFVPMGTVAGLF